jgi:small subunit ribosomal protein S1
LWQEAQRVQESGEAVVVQSTGCNRGGLLIDWNGLHGFMPASHITDLSPHLDEGSRRAELAQRVGKSFNAKVIELDRIHSRFVVSERAACPGHDRGESLLNDLCEGQVRPGAVTKVCTFGAFVDLGGVEGLLHISEISWGRVNHPADLLRTGQQVQVKIMNVERTQKRVALSVKRLQPDPWATVEQRYTVGQIVEGVVTSVVNFGAFTRLEEGLEGLIHISELAEGNFLHPHNVVHEGETVRVRILAIDGAHRRLGLSLRQANDGGQLLD